MPDNWADLKFALPGRKQSIDDLIFLDVKLYGPPPPPPFPITATLAALDSSDKSSTQLYRSVSGLAEFAVSRCLLIHGPVTQRGAEDASQRKGRPISRCSVCFVET
jgi:hypothetical protein